MSLNLCLKACNFSLVLMHFLLQVIMELLNLLGLLQPMDSRVSYSQHKLKALMARDHKLLAAEVDTVKPGG